ncbi:hypothetical protein [Pseudorhizobium endolithicum]|uniref:hypothetical protein n=1 Tax=Pseudorhizobium endolithicum TaxID=1191678 RepID=UPI001F32D29E|nr:hypothetical protein [Pseudorhizobium endolithicum]
MAKSSFEEQIMQGVYVLGRQRDQLAFEKRRLARQLRYAQHSPGLRAFQSNRTWDGLLRCNGSRFAHLVRRKQWLRSWMTPVLSLPLILFACGNALRGERWSADQKLQSLFR